MQRTHVSAENTRDKPVAVFLQGAMKEWGVTSLREVFGVDALRATGFGG
jgi:hypothetical protein